MAGDLFCFCSLKQKTTERSRHDSVQKKTENPNKKGIVRNANQAVLGAAVLLLGLLLYAHARPPLYNFLTDLQLPNLVQWVSHSSFGWWCSFLPSFIHVMSMSLICAALLPQEKWTFLLVCASWVFIDTVFELLQLTAPFVSVHYNGGLDRYALIENTIGYFIDGTFDPNDLLAVLVGGLIAYAVLFITRKTKKELVA